LNGHLLLSRVLLGAGGGGSMAMPLSFHWARRGAPPSPRRAGLVAGGGSAPQGAAAASRRNEACALRLVPLKVGSSQGGRFLPARASARPGGSTPRSRAERAVTLVGRPPRGWASALMRAGVGARRRLKVPPPETRPEGPKTDGLPPTEVGGRDRAGRRLVAVRSGTPHGDVFPIRRRR